MSQILNANNKSEEIFITKENRKFYDLLCDNEIRKMDFEKILTKECNEYYSLEKYRTVRFLRKDIDIVGYEDFKRVIFERDNSKIESMFSKIFLDNLTVENLRSLVPISEKNGWDLKSLYEAYISNIGQGRRLASILSCRNK